MNLSNTSLYDKVLIGLACPKCWYIFFPARKNSAQQCPQCQCQDEQFNTFPYPAAIDILCTLHSLKMLANEKRKTRVKQIIQDLSEEIGTTYDQGQINQLIIDLDKAYNKCIRTYPDNMTRLIMERLNISDENTLETASKIIVGGSNIVPEYKPIVLLTTSLVELFFKNFIHDYISAKLNPETAYRFLKQVKENNTKKNIELINCFLNTSLETEMLKINPKFYHQWSALRKSRNEIIHNNSFLITSNYAENVYKLSKQAVILFAELNNSLVHPMMC